MNANEFRCAACGGVFVRGWTDAEAQAEAVALFGRDGHAPDMCVVCDDCDRAMRTAFPMPTHCMFCGAYLKGWATEHEPDCEIPRMIREAAESVREDCERDTRARVARDLAEARGPASPRCEFCGDYMHDVHDCHARIR